MTITQERLMELVDYDPETGIFRWKKPTSVRVAVGDTIKPNKNSRYLRIQLDKRRYYAHLLAWLWVYGYFPKQVDHWDNDAMNNRISNLRRATQKQNCWNRKINRNNSSGVKGVSWHARSKKWQADISVNGQRIHLGGFSDLEKARNVMAAARIQFHGAYARE